MARPYLAHDERRAQILAVAARLFSERSIDSVSTVEIAREAGVARGLVHHYFGTKRELYLEVVRDMMRVPDEVFPGDGVLSDSVDRWLTMVERNRGTWLAAIGAQGFGSDPEVEAIANEARDRVAERIIAVIWNPSAAPGDVPEELRAIIRGYGGFAETIAADWLIRRAGRACLTRAQVHELLLRTLTALVQDVLPRVQSTPRKAA